jgi:putative hydrolase of the HAD superfamily
MASLLETQGRGRIFNEWLDSHGSANEAIKVYRHHTPQITLWNSASEVLKALAVRPLYMVTDGHKIVQAKKIEALGIASYFKHAYITHRYGIRYEKPSTYCFELIKKRESCAWDNMIYIGDNPNKDFVSLNTLGVHTVRVSSGQYASVPAKAGYDAKYTIPDISHLLTLLPKIR